MELIRLGTYNTTTEANLVRAKLQDAGISAVVQSDDLGATTPMLGNVRGVQVLVRESDRAEAMGVLERVLPPASGPNDR